jgi:hypothetical protein
MSQSALRSVRAKILARRGQPDQAVELGREAVRLVDRTDTLDDRAEFRLNLAEILSMASFLDEAIQVIYEALSLFEQKGNIVSASRARKLMEALISSTPTEKG